MKGFVGGFLALAILLMTMVTVIVLPTSFQISTTQMTQYEKRYSDVQMTQLTMLRWTHTDSLDNKMKPVAEIIAEYLVLQRKPDISFLSNNPDIVENNLYELKTTEIALAKGKDVGKNYLTKEKIVLPYNPEKLVEELIMVID